MNPLKAPDHHAPPSAGGAHRPQTGAQVAARLLTTQTQLAGTLRDQQRELGRLRRDLKRRAPRAGFPWRLALLAGAGYALYRATPDVRGRVQGLLRGGAGPQGTEAPAGSASPKRAPVEAFQRAPGESRPTGAQSGDPAVQTGVTDHRSSP